METAVETRRVVIVGAGIAALYAALMLAPRPVLVLSPDPLGEGAGSAWAQGGVAAAMGGGDSPALHAADTRRAGAGIVDEGVAAHVTDAARWHIGELTSRGTPFDRSADGGYVLSREAAHGLARVVRVGGDRAGRAIMDTLIAAVVASPRIQVIEGVLASDLLVEAGRVRGVWVESAGAPSRRRAIRAPAVLLAGGGSGGLYAVTTNPPRIRGQVIGMAARAGAVIADAEFVQFHPTAIECGLDPAPLATEALRGEGAVLIDSDGRRFMLGVAPEAELAPRDVVAAAVFAETRAGRRPMLDTRAAIGAEIGTRFPTVAEACLRAGIDPVRDPIPVVAAAHYHMGGIEVSLGGRASLPGLWVCGEAGCSGLHGANRLASNGLLEALVFGRDAAMDIAGALGGVEPAGLVALNLVPGGQAVDAEAVARLRGLMTADVGVLRDATGLRRALRGIAEIEAGAAGCPALLNMTATATLIAICALAREESRGAHRREDFPEEVPGLARRSRLTLGEARALRDAAILEQA